MYSLIHLFFAANDLPKPIVAYLNARQGMALLVESAGVFWIGAELLILFLVLAGRRHVDSVPLTARFTLTANERRRALVWGLGYAALSAVVLGRYALAGKMDVEHLSSRLHAHLVIWSAFVTMWVVLEVVIVHQGWRGYRRLREIVDRATWRGVTSAATIPILVCAGLLASWHAAAADADALRQAIRDANAADQVYWNALYLYLRLAGVVWIAVEWWAAIVLVHGYRLMARATMLRKGAT